MSGARILGNSALDAKEKGAVRLILMSFGSLRRCAACEVGMSNVNLKIPLCTIKIACDGTPVYRGRSMCSACKQRLERKEREARKLNALRGEKFVVSDAKRRKTAEGRE